MPMLAGLAVAGIIYIISQIPFYVTGGVIAAAIAAYIFRNG